jgi:hypothetical protein
MNIKDIEIDKYYSIKIWEDDYPLFLKCIDKDDEYFIMQSLDMKEPTLIQNINSELDSLEEIPPLRFLVYVAGLLVENNLFSELEKLMKDNNKLFHNINLGLN